MKNKIIQKMACILFLAVMVASMGLASACRPEEPLVYNYGIDAPTVRAYADVAETKVYDLKTNGLIEPTSLDNTPVFTWKLQSHVLK